MSEKHDIKLNIHYSAPDEVWSKISEVYETMLYWTGYNPLSHWSGKET